jgi:DNA-directed RNA polymerase specialized sigma24 family protein
MAGGAAITKTGLNKDWSPTRGAFRQFLNWLDEGVDSDGERYLEMRRRLVAYFDRKNCLTPDELADETLNRVARRLEEEGAITVTTPARYCYIVAKFVFLEYLRRAERSETELTESPATGLGAAPRPVLSQPEPALEAKEDLFDCLEDCLHKLLPTDRELIVEYYRGEQKAKIDRRRGLAAQFGLTTNALSIRACRIRNKLEFCLQECAEKR